MTIATTLYSRLSGFAGLIAIVADRIYPGAAEQDALSPYVVFRIVSGPRDSNMGSDSGIVKARYQFDCFADDFDTCDAVKVQVLAAIARYRTVVGNTIFDIFIENELDLGLEAETKKHHIVIDAEVNYSE